MIYQSTHSQDQLQPVGNLGSYRFVKVTQSCKSRIGSGPSLVLGKIVAHGQKAARRVDVGRGWLTGWLPAANRGCSPPFSSSLSSLPSALYPHPLPLSLSPPFCPKSNSSLSPFRFLFPSKILAAAIHALASASTFCTVVSAKTPLPVPHDSTFWKNYLVSSSFPRFHSHPQIRSLSLSLSL